MPVDSSSVEVPDAVPEALEVMVVPVALASVVPVVSASVPVVEVVAEVEVVASAVVLVVSSSEVVVSSAEEVELWGEPEAPSMVKGGVKL